MNDTISTPPPEVIATQQPECLPPVSPGDGVPISRKCRICKQVLPAGSFFSDKLRKYGIGYVCRVCSSARDKNGRVTRPGFHAKHERKYRRAHPEKAREAHSRRYKTDIEYATRHRLRSRIHASIKRATGGSSAVFGLGCSIREFLDHMRAQFTEGMSDSNYGKGVGRWSYDHIVPLSMVALATSPSDSAKALHYSNLRPMWDSENVQRNSDGEYEAELKSLGLLNDAGVLTFPYDYPEKFPLRTLDRKEATMLT